MIRFPDMQVTQSMHEGMKAEVLVDGNVTADFKLEDKTVQHC